MISKCLDVQFVLKLKNFGYQRMYFRIYVSFIEKNWNFSLDQTKYNNENHITHNCLRVYALTFLFFITILDKK